MSDNKNALVDNDFVLVKGEKTALGHPLYVGVQTGKRYGYLSSRSTKEMYYPIDQQGNPLDVATTPRPFASPQIIDPLEPENEGNDDDDDNHEFNRRVSKYQGGFEDASNDPDFWINM